MNFNIEKSKFFNSLQKVCEVINRKPEIPILNNLLVVAEKDRIILTGSDTEVEMVTTINSDSETFGEITVPARKLLNICKALPHDTTIEFSLDKNHLLVKSNKSKFALMTLPADGYPTTENIKSGYQFSLTQKEFRELLESTRHSVAQQDVRYYLQGLLLEFKKGSLCAVATDGHRLAFKKINLSTDIEKEQQIIIPKKGVNTILSLLDREDEKINVEIDQNHIKISKEGVQFTSKLIDAKFPDYRKVIPEGGEYPIKINRDILKDVLYRVSLLSDEKYTGIKLELTNTLLKVSARNPDKEYAEEEIVIDYKGEEIEIGFNAAYLLEALSSIKTEEVILNVSDSNSSCLIVPEGETDCKYVIMPMKL